MPDRIVRDELLTSERYWSVSIEAQQLFVHLLLRADSLGRFTGKNFSIRMACYPGHARNPDLIEKFLGDLNDADLIRLYTVGAERFIFIPRYRQRLRYLNSAYPEPPKEINDIAIEKSDHSQTQVRPAPLEVKRSEEVPLPKRKRSAAKGEPDPKPNGIATWDAYSQAYRERYGVEPVRNAQVNAMISRFCTRVSHAEAPAIAAFYVGHDQQGYVRAKHPVSLMLRDAEGLHTDWATNKPVTETEARNIDKTGSRKKIWSELIEESHAKPKP